MKNRTPAFWVLAAYLSHRHQLTLDESDGLIHEMMSMHAGRMVDLETSVLIMGRMDTIVELRRDAAGVYVPPAKPISCDCQD